MTVRPIRLVVGHAPGIAREIHAIDQATAATIRRLVRAFIRMEPETRVIFSSIAEEFSRPPLDAAQGPMRRDD
jgi:hypothetical protein